MTNIDITKIILQDLQEKIGEINNITEYLNEYSQVNTYMINKKYKETINNNLEKLNIAYTIQDIPLTENILITIVNLPVIQRENIINNIQKL